MPPSPDGTRDSSGEGAGSREDQMPESQSTQSHIVVTDVRLPADHMILDGIDVSEGPHYTVSEVAKVFFGKSAHWVRWREREGFFVLDGEEVGSQRSQSGARRYDLADIEKIAHALADKNAINGGALTNALIMVQANARIWGYL